MDTYRSPKEFALAHLRPYVLRGDSLDYICTPGGQSDINYSLSVGSMYIYNNDQMVYKAKSDELVVDCFNGVDCCHIFKVRDLYNQIKQEKEQPLLFDY